MKTALAVVLICATVQAQNWKIQDGVVVQKVDKANLFVFSSGVTLTPMGTIKVGDTITVRYGLKLNPRSKARYISFDSGPVSTLDPKLTVRPSATTGFAVQDLRQRQLNLHVGLPFKQKMSKNRIQLKEGIAKEANLTVKFTTKDRHVIISDVYVTN